VDKLTTAEIQKWLTTNIEIQELVYGRVGDPEDVDPEEVTDYFKRVMKDFKNPKKWVRVRKYNVGSPTDMDLGIRCGEGFPHSPKIPDLTGGIIREFVLKGTSIGVLLVEKADKIVFIEDLSD